MRVRVSGAEDYFGLIYIGDTGSFKKLVEDDDSGIVLEEDVISESLFDGIKRPDSKINILIGAKKFMEGWNSWRVSNMGLLNIGRKEGSQIIQMFGRGVRLRGLGLSLKRSSALDGAHPEHISLLETLNIFSIRANYMAQFREYLEREDVETEGHVELPVAIKPNRDFLRRGLVIARIPEDADFVRETNIMLDRDKAAIVSVDMSLKVQTVASGAGGVMTASLKAGSETIIPEESLDLIDWEKVYLELLEYKEQKGYCNLIITPDAPRKILEAREPRLYRLVADDSIVNPTSFEDSRILQEAVLNILCKYVDKFYRTHKERWDSEHMIYKSLVKEDSNFQNYMVKIPRSETQLIKAVQELIEEGERVYKEEAGQLPRIHFDRHLYQPLLVEKGEKVKSDPPGLEESELQFVKDLRAFMKREADKSLASKEIFLLRNLSRGKGVRFFDTRGFYPDFILWIKEGEKQRIIFVEPHGMMNEISYAHDDKAQLHEKLPELSKALVKKSGLKEIAMDSFIVSATKYEDLREKYDDGTWDRCKFAEKHILFLERSPEYDYVSLLFAD